MKYAIGIAGSTYESVGAIASENGELLAVSRGNGLNLQEMRFIDFYRSLASLILR